MAQDASIDVLFERLKRKFDDNEIAVCFRRNKKLLEGRLDNVSFYASLLENKSELNDWYQMAIDFELSLEKRPINKQILLKRYTELILSPDNLYEKIHFDVGLSIMDEMERFTNAKIFSFQ